MTEADFAALIGATRNALHDWGSADREVPQSRLEDNLLQLLRQSCDNRNVDVIEVLLRRARDARIELSLSAADASQLAPEAESSPKAR